MESIGSDGEHGAREVDAHLNKVGLGDLQIASLLQRLRQSFGDRVDIGSLQVERSGNQKTGSACNLTGFMKECTSLSMDAF